MVEIILRKRKAQPGEVGLFLDAAGIFDEEWSSLPHDVDVKAECTVPSNLKYLRFFFALLDKIVDNSPDDRFLDKEDCRKQLLLNARHYKAVTHHLTQETELKPRSVSNLSADTWIRLLRRCTHVVITKYLPGMEEGALKAEICTMLGMDVFAAPPPKSQPKGGGHGKPPEPLPHSETIAPAAEPRPEGPQNEEDYVAACRSWIEKQTDHVKALAYYDSTEQIATRVHLEIKVGTNRMLRRELAEHCAKVKQGAPHA
jgi:hypothetical protein